MTGISEVLKAFLIQEINFGEIQRAQIALDIVFNLSTYLYLSPFPGEREKLGFYWEEIVTLIIESCSARVSSICKHQSSLAYNALYRDLISIEDYLEFGFVYLFKEIGTILTQNIHSSSFVDTVFRSVISFENFEYLKRTVNLLEQLGGVTLYLSQPWLKVPANPSNLLHIPQYNSPNSKPLDSKYLTPNLLFGIFAILSTIIEIHELSIIDQNRGIPSYVAEIIIKLGLLNRCILVRSDKNIEDQEVQTEMDKYGFSPEQQAFIWRWIRHEITLVQLLEPSDQPEESDFIDPTTSSIN